MKNYSWSNSYYHDSKGKIMGSVTCFVDKYKALGNNLFLGFFISEDHAKGAVEEYIDDISGELDE